MSQTQSTPSPDRLLAALAAGAGDDPVRLRALALAQAGQERYDEAIATFERALKRDPSYAAGWISLALLLHDLRRVEEAIAAAQRATDAAPDDRLAWHTLGVILHQVDRLDEAVAAQRRAAAIDPGYRDAWRWLGYSLQMDGDLEGAVAAYERAQALHFDPVTALNTAMLAPPHPETVAQIDWARARIPRALQALADSGYRLEAPETVVQQVTGLYAYWGGEDRPLHEAQAAFWRRVTPGLEWTAPHVASWKPPVGRKPRIACITRFVYSHTIDRLFGRLLRRLPALDFEMTLFTTRDTRDEVSADLEAHVGPFVRLPATMAEARQVIASFAPDIVLYPELGLHAFSYFMGFARLAPLQVVTWGHAATSGLRSIDCFVSDDLLDPPGNERFYTERELVRLPTAPVRFAPQEELDDVSRAHFGLPEDVNLYVCVQSLLKLRPDFDAVLARIVANDPKGVLVLIGASIHQSPRILDRRLTRAFAGFGDRLRLLGHLSPEDFARITMLADALLDTPNFSGGVTAYEALARGKAFVTLPGAALKGRVGFSLYTRLGITELIARDLDHYVELAHRLANDRPWREEIEARIAQRAPGLFADESGIDAFADFLHQRIARADA